jgi:hypothetical protein
MLTEIEALVDSERVRQDIHTLRERLPTMSDAIRLTIMMMITVGTESKLSTTTPRELLPKIRRIHKAFTWSVRETIDLKDRLRAIQADQKALQQETA